MRTTLLSLVLMLICGMAFGQKTAYVNTETVFKNIPEYNQALQKLDAFGKQQQKTVDSLYNIIENNYNNYQAQRQYLSDAQQMRFEEEMANDEKRMEEFQKSIFGPEGTFLKKRIELIKPIQDKVFEAIRTLAQKNQYEAVIDIANNPTLLYYNPTLEITKAVLIALGYSN